MTNREKILIGALVLIIVIVGVIGSIFAPDYKKVTKENVTLKTTVDTLSKSVTQLQAELVKSKEALTKSYVSWKSKIPVFSPSGEIAYAETSGRSFNMSSVKEQMEQSVKDMTEVQASTHSEAVTVIKKSETVTKRGFAEVGAGMSTNKEACLFMGVKVIGPLGVWGVAASDKVIPKRGEFGAKLAL